MFIKAINESKNIHETLIKIGMNSRGAAYKTFKQRCKKLNVDISHFTTDKHIRSKLSDKDIIAAITSCISRQGTLKTLGLNPHSGANVGWIDKKIKSLTVDTSHWLGMGYLKNKTHSWAKGKQLSEILVKDSDFLWNTNLKKKLLKNGLIKYQCSECSITEWRGKPISLQLEHKNGDHSDNRIENLCLLCPNCHSQTPTFAGKNIGKNSHV